MAKKRSKKGISRKIKVNSPIVPVAKHVGWRQFVKELSDYSRSRGGLFSGRGTLLREAKRIWPDVADKPFASDNYDVIFESYFGELPGREVKSRSKGGGSYKVGKLIKGGYRSFVSELSRFRKDRGLKFVDGKSFVSEASDLWGRYKRKGGDYADFFRSIYFPSEDIDYLHEKLELEETGLPWWFLKITFDKVIIHEGFKDNSIFRLYDSTGDGRDFGKLDSDKFHRTIWRPMVMAINKKNLYRSSDCYYRYIGYLVEEDSRVYQFEIDQYIYPENVEEIAEEVFGDDYRAKDEFKKEPSVEKVEEEVKKEVSEKAIEKEGGLSQREKEEIQVKEEARIGKLVSLLREDLKAGLIDKQEYLDMLLKLK